MTAFLPGLSGLAFVALWIWSIIDIIATDKIAFRRMSKPFWLILTLFAPIIGAIGWLLLGRPRNAGFAPGAKLNRPSLLNRPSPPRGLEDDDRWSASTAPSLPSNPGSQQAADDFAAWETEINKRESGPTDD